MWGNISTTFPKLMNKFPNLFFGTPVAQVNGTRKQLTIFQLQIEFRLIPQTGITFALCHSIVKVLHIELLTKIKG